MAQPQSHSQSQRSHLFILHQPIRDPDPKPLLSSSPPPTLYRECMRNHAASLGAHAVDGCGEFMPALPSSPLSCAACGCHRNFHRRLPLPPASATHAGDSSSGDDDPGPEPPSAPHMLMALSAVAPKKRFRSKFSAEQKERMLSLSERLGWRMLRKDEGFIEDCCREIGIDKAVFKVWMHNNKHHFYGASRRASEAPPPPPPPLPPAAAAVSEANGSSSSS